MINGIYFSIMDIYCPFNVYGLSGSNIIHPTLYLNNNNSVLI